MADKVAALIHSRLTAGRVGEESGVAQSCRGNLECPFFPVLAVRIGRTAVAVRGTS